MLNKASGGSQTRTVEGAYAPCASRQEHRGVLEQIKDQDNSDKEACMDKEWSLSVSNPVSKLTVYENTEFSRAFFEDLKGRKGDSITNEQIRNGDPILDTYKVTSDAILGGMGSVWKVHHNSWNTDLAMKRPQPRFFAEAGDEKKKQFVEECETWINLGLHPNIVSCYYVREIGGVPTIFSEWMDGGSLSDRIRDGSLYEGTEKEIQKRILDIAIQSARGLLYSHKKGLIHLDIKPGNLLLTKEWDTKVADFGLAKAKSQLDDGSDATRSTGYTLAYCPREQADGEEPARWMDVYAWALTVLEMYAGGRLWNTGAEAKKHFDDYPKQCPHSIPDELRSLLKVCLMATSDADGPDFSAVSEKLEKIRLEMTGERYAGAVLGESALVSAVNLNNYALSMLDMGKEELAENYFEQSLALQPDILSARINYVFFSKKNGNMSYEEAMKIFQNLPASKEKDEAIRTLITEHFGLEEIKRLSGRTYDFNSSAHFDSSGFLWMLSYDRPHQVLYRYNGRTGEKPGRSKGNADGGIFYGRNGYNSIVMDSEGRYLYAVEYTGELYYTITTRIHCIDTRKPDREPDNDFIGEDSETIKRYREKNSVYGQGHNTECLALWLENHDRTLCLIEGQQWKTQGEDFYTTYSFAQYNVANHRKISMIGERIYLGEYEGRLDPYKSTKYYQRYLKATEEKWKRIKSYHEDAVAVSPAGDRVLLREGIDIVKTGIPTLYRPCPQGEKNHVYLLNRFSDAASVGEWVETRTELESAFDEAVRREDYNEAIRIFEEYRELPERRDAAVTIKMERMIAAACRRVRLHHCIEAVDCDFHPAKKPFLKKVSFHSRKDSGITKKDRERAEELSDHVFKALHKAAKRIPVEAEDLFGGKHYFGNGARSGLSMFCIEGDEKNGYVYFRGDWVARFDVENGKFLLLANLQGDMTFGFYLSPNTKLLAVNKNYQTDKGFKTIYDIYDETDGSRWTIPPVRSPYNWTASVPDPRDVMFSPDSRFLIWRDYNTELYYMSGTQEKGEYVQVYDSKNLKGSPQFSGDGFYLAVNSGGKMIRTFRLSYQYVFDGFRDWDDEADLFARQFLFENPSWDEAKLDAFMEELSRLGLGFLRKEGVRKKLTEMSRPKPQKGFFAFLKR